MKRAKSTLALLVLCSIPQLCLSQTSIVEGNIPPIDAAKQTLLVFWEKTLKDDPETKSFSKTDQPLVYEIETSILPYKGRIKVLNVVVDRYHPIGEYDKKIVYGAVVETELIDAPNDFGKEQSFSFMKWQRLNWFNYDAATSEWFPFSKWNEHFSPQSADSYLAVVRPSNLSNGTLRSLVTAPGAIDAAMLIIIAVAIAVNQRHQKRYHDAIVRQSQLLADILAAMKKSS